MINPCKTLFNGEKSAEDPFTFLKDIPGIEGSNITKKKKKKRGRPKGSKNKKKKRPSPKKTVIPTGLTENPLDGLPNVTNNPSLWTSFDFLDQEEFYDHLLKEIEEEEEEVLDFGFAPITFKSSFDFLNTINPKNKVLNYVHVLSRLKKKLEKDRSDGDTNVTNNDTDEFHSMVDIPTIMSQDEIEFILSWSLNLLNQHVQDFDEKQSKCDFTTIFKDDEETLLPHLSLEDVLPVEDPDFDLLQASVEQLLEDLPDDIVPPVDESFTYSSPPPLPSSPPRKRIVRYEKKEKKRRRGRPRKPRAFESNTYIDPKGQTLLDSYFQI